MRPRTAPATLIAAGLLVAAWTPLLGIPPAHAATGATITAVSWWTRQPGAAARSGGFQVASAPNGDFSVAALRVRVDSPSLIKAVLVLTEKGGLRQDTGVVQVCPTTGTWGPADPGAFADAPTADCRQPVHLERNSSATPVTWRADLLPLLNGGASPVSLMVVPGPASLPVDPGFQLDVAATSLEAEGTPPSAATGPAEPSPPSGVPTSGDSTSTPAATSIGGTGATGAPTPLDLSAPPPAFSPAPSSTPVATASVPEPPAPPPELQLPGTFPRRLDTGGGIHHRRKWGRLLLFVPLCAVIGIGGAVGRHAAQESWGILRLGRG